MTLNDKLKEHEDALRPRLTDDFLNTLVKAGRVVGNSADSVATRDFIQQVFSIAGREMPEWKPYDETLR